MEKEGKYRDRSRLIHGRFKTEKWDFSRHVLPPITTSVAFRLGSLARGAEGFRQFANPEVDRAHSHPIYVYDRLDEPCEGMLEEALAFAERGETAVAFASGMAAISAVAGVLLKAGDSILVHRTLYGCTYSLVTNWLPRFGIGHDIADLGCPDCLTDALAPETRVVLFETPVNPTLELIDIAAVTATVAEANARRTPEERIRVVVDNTFATPFCQRPLELGADVVVHSLTKNMSGFGADMGGAAICARDLEPALLMFRKDFGGALSPRSAWNILNFGISTLAVRIERQQRSALEVAAFLAENPKVARVSYPGLPDFPQAELARRQMVDFDGGFAPGSMIHFDVAGGPDAAARVVDHLAKNALAVTLAVSLGQVRTLVEMPAAMTHSTIPPEHQAECGISPAGVRLSMGLEDVRDIVADLEAALRRA